MVTAMQFSIIYRMQEDERLAQWATDADRSIKSRAWNEKKITAHHAIIPTTVAWNVNSLSREERNIYFPH